MLLCAVLCVCVYITNNKKRPTSDMHGAFLILILLHEKNKEARPCVGWCVFGECDEISVLKDHKGCSKTHK